MDKRYQYTAGWLAWGGFFLWLEGTAIRNKRWDGTLSNHVRKWVGESAPHQTWWTYTKRGALLGFLTWLTGHLVMGWWG